MPRTLPRDAAPDEDAPEDALEGSLEDIVPGDEEPAADGVVDGGADRPDDGAEDRAPDDTNAPGGPGEIVGAIAFVIPSTDLSRDRVV